MITWNWQSLRINFYRESISHQCGQYYYIFIISIWSKKHSPNLNYLPEFIFSASLNYLLYKMHNHDYLVFCDHLAESLRVRIIWLRDFPYAVIFPCILTEFSCIASPVLLFLIFS